VSPPGGRGSGPKGGPPRGPRSGGPDRGRPPDRQRPPERQAPITHHPGRREAPVHGRAPAPAPPETPAAHLAEQAALAYLARGWSVIPLRPADKRPLVAWQEFQHRRPSEAVVRAWFRQHPEAGLGIVTGLVSGLLVLDVDAAHGGEASLQRLSQAHGPLPWTVEAHTGGGGRHLYFAHPGGVVPNRAGLRPGLDLRGDGGYVVAPPSSHPSGAGYRWSETASPERAHPAPPPVWLLKLVAAPGGRGRAGHPLAYWRNLVKTGVTEGERNTTVASLAGHLLFHGTDPEVVTELLLCWNRVRCRPPLADEEVARTVASIARTHERHREAGEGEGPEFPDATEIDGA
jgi:Bifunctional DNA primase/polymerase, N-terminal/Primase C terminal 1 (PriCT-1)